MNEGEFAHGHFNGRGDGHGEGGEGEGEVEERYFVSFFLLLFNVLKSKCFLCKFTIYIC